MVRGIIGIRSGELTLPSTTPRSSTTPSSSTIVWAVRRDWRIDGTHEFVCPRSSERAAIRQMAKDRAFWRLGPIRPELTVVVLSAHEFALHGDARRDCRAPDCAVAAPAAPSRPDDRVGQDL